MNDCFTHFWMQKLRENEHSIVIIQFLSTKFLDRRIDEIHFKVKIVIKHFYNMTINKSIQLFIKKINKKVNSIIKLKHDHK